MNFFKRIALLLIIPSISLAQSIPTPDQLYGDLFVQVQMQRIFPDSKTFVDCTPKRPVKDIMYDYGMMKGPNMNLKKFVLDNFQLPADSPSTYVTSEKDVAQHINNLWPVLKRQPDKALEGSSLLPLPHPYIVPGGRFREVYYWDSYFTMLGLKESGEVAIIENMIDNFAYFIDKYGHIPNGNRSYYISRSQPPFFSLMVALLAEIKGQDVYVKYLSALQKEYDYWMRGAATAKAGQAAMSVVKMNNGDVLNRYWDDLDIPRQESYREDVLTADTFAMQKMSVMRFSSAEAQAAMEKKLKAEAYRHLRAGAASGWDFSTRWFEDGISIHTIQTTKIIPVDLNALLYHLEIVLCKAYKLSGNKTASKTFDTWATKRAKLINQYCWNEALGYYTDYNFETKQKNDMITAAGMYPFCLLPAADVAGKMKQAAQQLQTHLLKEGGVLSTAVQGHQQWDAPNGWAPLQWMTIWALDRNNEKPLAASIAKRWIVLNKNVFARTGKLMEKYNVINTTLDAGGGEYPSQDGFGWTNGVLLSLMKKYEGQ